LGWIGNETIAGGELVTPLAESLAFADTVS
jgi:hypothetical protein